MPFIEPSRQDLLASGAAVLVNPVNCVGVMGAGLARRFAGLWPEMLADYRTACRRGTLRPGGIHTHRVAEARWVANLPTKDHWRDPARIEWVDSGLVALAGFLASGQHRSVAVPALGCGLGGLSWEQVEPLVRSRLAELSEAGVVVELYPPR